MHAMESPGASDPLVVVRGHAHVGPALGPIVSALLRTLVLIAVAMLLILVLLPAALGAAGIPMARAA